MRVFDVYLQYPYFERDKDESGLFIDKDLPSLMERLMLSHPNPYKITVTDKGNVK